MAAGFVLIVAPPLLLLVAGVTVLVQGARGRRKSSTAGFGLRLTGGIGLRACAILGMSGLWLDVHYAVVVLPVVALILGGVWLIVFCGGAILADWLVVRRGRRR